MNKQLLSSAGFGTVNENMSPVMLVRQLLILGIVTITITMLVYNYSYSDTGYNITVSPPFTVSRPQQENEFDFPDTHLGETEEYENPEAMSRDLLYGSQEVMSKDALSDLNSDYMPVQHDRGISLEETDVIVISNWTTKMKKQRWLLDGDESFRECTNLEPWMRCWFNHSAAAYNASHAVFFRGQHVFRNDGPPTYRPKGQKWMYYETEPPTKTWGSHLDYYSDVWRGFNITMTYTSDSTIQNNIYKQRCVLNPQWKPSKINYAKGKKGKVAWFVSNCDTPSFREGYVEQLKKFIPVDIYGACGSSKCPEYLDGSNCIQKLLNKDYKFYLSFENSLCDEYYTEKISRTLKLMVIPIVLGRVDYSQDLPPGSYLDVRNFSSPMKLAEYLSYLDKNPAAYNRYIENMRKYYCYSYQHDHSFPCRLCRHLHTHRHETEIVSDIRTFWGTRERCLTPKEYYRNIAKPLVKRKVLHGAFLEPGFQQNTT